uniref:RNA-directed DNA polymerase, eukaryota, reverse transcriptase zinc-binding domain protein n=1 Tax=Tanacetum cinerariifolium TaxID=118510 RepID=A0A6L2MCR2_TANCI|nr:RNA-directed DNA polymerase, eukaryota, reverse transcriptase zinc-binding domain protein [Tanacetum cinerariifolium]
MAIYDESGKRYENDEVANQFLKHFKEFLGKEDKVETMDEFMSLYIVGDPIAPYLFTLVMEVLNLLMKKNIREAANFRYHFGCKRQKITHICFADDLMVFYNGDISSAKVIKRTLEEFSGISGLKLNMEKSTVFFRGMNLMEQNNILKIIPFFMWKFPMKYLAKKDTQWVKWINVEKLKGRNLWDMQIDSNNSPMWKTLLGMRDKLIDHIWVEIGNGKSTSVWYDNLHSMGPLCSVVTKRDVYDARMTDKYSEIIWKKMQTKLCRKFSMNWKTVIVEMSQLKRSKNIWCTVKASSVVRKVGEQWKIKQQRHKKRIELV